MFFLSLVVCFLSYRTEDVSELSKWRRMPVFFKTTTKMTIFHFDMTSASAWKPENVLYLAAFCESRVFLFFFLQKGANQLSKHYLVLCRHFLSFLGLFLFLWDNKKTQTSPSNNKKQKIMSTRSKTSDSVFSLSFLLLQYHFLLQSRLQNFLSSLMVLRQITLHGFSGASNFSVV